MNGKKVLMIGMVWPEPTSSAAGTRIVQLIETFLSAKYDVIFASAAAKSDYSHPLTQMGVTELAIQLNNASFNEVIKSLSPDIVLFDRFMTEEQYGWRVQQECPNALTLLDTEDLHCLRYARQQAIKTGRTLQPADLFSDIAKREIAAILRSDLALIISEEEMTILKTHFRVDPALLYYLPFLEDGLMEERVKQWKSFETREGFCFIGNYLHEPNWHTLQVIKTQVWPLLRKRVPGARMHIYGAYASQKVLQLHNEKEKFLVHGRATDAREAIASHRMLLAPIQFGAGVKGKFIDAMQTGTPAVTTTIGAEAMRAGLDWNGCIADDLTVLVDQAAALYQDKTLWLQSQENGVRILNERYCRTRFSGLFMEKLHELSLNLSAHRSGNFMGQLLQYHTFNSSKYMSLWIEEKNKNK